MTNSFDYDENRVNLLRENLEPFLTRNPEAELKADDGGPLITRPWGEEAIDFPLSGECDTLIEALNAVRLPPRFTAIWHDDTSELEFIFTVLRKDSPLLNRAFTFDYKGTSYPCGFEPSSQRLEVIAQSARPSGNLSPTEFRNLPSYQLSHRSRGIHPGRGHVRNSIPTSFWIRALGGYDEDFIVDLARNLNFHMSYYDRQTPVVLIHDDPGESRTEGTLNIEHTGYFPDLICARDVDQLLLVLWASAELGDPFLRFIRYYQILEYAGFYYVKRDIQLKVARAIAAPDARVQSEKVAERLIDAMSEYRMQDSHKINAVIEACVDPEELWEVLEASLPEFSKDVELDGGFILPALISGTPTYEEFLQSWNKNFAENVHQVRNALVHARESRQATTIAPTKANRIRLSLWLLPLSHTAARVMLYSDI